MNKDILQFHTVCGSVMLGSEELTIVAQVCGHGFLTEYSQKMRKILDKTLNLEELIEGYGTEAICYDFLNGTKLSQDGGFREIRFNNSVNTDLVGDRGNWLKGILDKANKYCRASVSAIPTQAILGEHSPNAIRLKLREWIAKADKAPTFSKGCCQILIRTEACNKFLDDQVLWNSYKQGKQQSVDQVLYTIWESVRLAAYLLSPIIANISTAIYQKLGYPIDIYEKALIKNSATYPTHALWGIFPSKQSLDTPKPVFSRLESSLSLFRRLPHEIN
ncbi:MULTISPECIES: class I tRNA ligase family protein [unclassified Coleofasciculus]|uniref:class I tRNA ligase family protein n=1 Tax=unclassified Coleofasciculus TaxID=2692782 RepID=UPI00188035F4|nr:MULTISPECIES: class I tRNA ligase family protein [unclassified Coleofasciculus]MBE9124963.1 class I tRNA ligase family protein [Coleofasciculus sp. LEGE 07081]MBE9147987.1 class I tRNA ligase family protein [Coleofasciculus sp. LEGE 07092]